MAKNQQRLPPYPHVRNAFGMDLSRQEYFQITGLSDMEEVLHIPGIVQGDWSNNWVPDCEVELTITDKDEDRQFS